MDALRTSSSDATLIGQLEGQRILITGGTTGIGRTTALLLAGLGAKVLLFGRHQQELDDIMEDSRNRNLGQNIQGFIADVSREDDIKKIFAEVDNSLQGLDILINNAAVSYQSIAEGSYADWQYVVNTNLLGYMACAHEAANRMIEQGTGHIVNIGSLSAKVRENGSSVYVATKAGIQGFSEALRKELNPLGIKVSLIEPGAVGTDMQSNAPGEQQQKEQEQEMLKAEDIAAAIVYVLSQPMRCDVISLQIRPHLQLI